VSAASIPEGARCARHPEDDAIDLCARCGDFVCKRCGVEIDGRRWCATCEPHAGDPFPWERRAEIGYPRAFVLTMRAAIAGDAVLARGFRDRSIVPAIAFGLLVAVPVVWVIAGVSIAMGAPAPEPDLHPAIVWLDSDAGLITLAMLAPLRFTLEVFMFSGAWWLGLKAAGVARRPFDQIVRSLAYTHGATAVLDLCGLLPAPQGNFALLVALLVSMVIQGRALGIAMRATSGQMVLAGVVMITVLFTLFCGIGLTVVGAVFFLGPGM
jgi:hypothetical protein